MRTKSVGAYSTIPSVWPAMNNIASAEDGRQTEYSSAAGDGTRCRFGNEVFVGNELYPQGKDFVLISLHFAFYVWPVKCVSMWLSSWLFKMWMSDCLPISLSINLHKIYLLTAVPTYMYLSVCLSVCLSSGYLSAVRLSVVWVSVRCPSIRETPIIFGNFFRFICLPNLNLDWRTIAGVLGCAVPVAHYSL